MAPEAPALYRLAQLVLRTGFTLLQGLKVEGLEHIPRSGACLIVANHLSWLDPPLLGCCVRHRQLHFMAKAELFEHSVLGPLIRRLGAFPVERGQADRKSLRVALQLMAEGKIVCLFPEGTRGESYHMQSWHVGMAMLAHHAQVQVIPAALARSRNLLEDRALKPARQPIRIRFGPALQLDRLQGTGKARLTEIQELCFAGVQRMLDQMTADKG